MSAIAKAADTQVARPLKMLVPLIRAELEAGDAAGTEHYRRAGEMLLEAKEQVAHGDWGTWLQRNFHRSETTARGYMALARAQNTRARAFSTLSEFIDPDRDSSHRPTWHKEVQKIESRVDTETLNLKREELKRSDEREAQRQLAVQLVDIGYKVLARKLHPDRGGSREAMARLNAVRDRLKGCV